jgi:hypothetical protein
LPWLDLVLTAIYALAVLSILRVDTLWFDEAQQWLIVRASHSLGELYRNRAHEGHPLPWYVFLKLFTLVFPAFPNLKLISFAVAVPACWVTLRYAPVNVLQKCLIPFGIYLLFIVACQSRPYMAGYILLFLAYVAARANRTKLSIVLLAIAGSLHFLFIPIAGMMLVWLLLTKDLAHPRTLFASGTTGWLVLATFLLFCVTLVIIYPESDTVQLVAANYTWNLTQLPSLISRTVMPGVPARAAFLPAILVIGCVTWIAFRSGLAIFLFYAGSVGFLLLYQTVGYGGAPWHLGMVYFCLLFTLFMALDRPAAGTLHRDASWLLTALLLIQVLATGLSAREIWLTPKSQGKAAAVFLESYCTTPCTYVADFDVSSVIVSAYLCGAEIYQVNRGVFGTFVKWDDKRHLPHGPAEVAEAAEKFDNPVLLFKVDPTPEDARRYGLVFLAAFTGAESPDEVYHIYRLAGKGG